jgi:hypothetical protein
MPTLTSAIAPTFTLSTAETFSMAFTTGPSPITVTMAARDYRMVLAPSSGSVRDYVREMTAAIQTALTGAGRTETPLVKIDATTLLVSISITTAEWSASETAGSPLRRLGFNATIPSSIIGADAPRPPLHLATFVERKHVGWQPHSVVSGAETIAGVPYGITSGVRRDEDEIAFGFLPRDPTKRAAFGLYQTSLQPDAAYAFSLGVVAAREWSALDVITSALGQPVAFALGTWQTVSQSTSEYYDLGAIKAESIMSPQIERTRDGWDAYYGITLGVTRSSVGTRA